MMSPSQHDGWCSSPREGYMSSPESQTWERLPNETDKAFAAFCQYLELGPDRSIGQAHQRQNSGKTAAKSRWWEEWSSQYDWVARARAFDSWEWQQKLETRQQAIEVSRQLLIDSTLRAAEDLVAVASNHQECDSVRLKAILEVLDRSGVGAVKTVEVSGPSGGPITTKDETPAPRKNTAEQALEIARILSRTGALSSLVDKTRQDTTELTTVNDTE